MAKLYPYLSFENSKEALTYYEQVFGATNISRLPVGEEQAKDFGIPVDKLADTTMHGGFNVLGAELFCSDNFNREKQIGHQISILLDVNSEDELASKEAADFFEKVANSGTVTVNLPYEDQFWGGKMGQFTDQYGILWMVHAQPYSQLK